MGFMGLSKAERESLTYEVVPERTRLLLTRLLRSSTRAESGNVQIILQNKAINIANHVQNLPIYRLQAEDGDYYYPEEHAWHNAELELLMRRPPTADLCEILADFIENGILHVSDVNGVLEEEGVSFGFSQSNFDDREVRVSVQTIEEIEEPEADRHPNIRLLINRMDAAVEAKDPSGVLHASASVFETLAKDVVSIEGVQDQTLASFFERYKKDSHLPTEILDYILETYKQRNKEPLAGHGSTKAPTITEEKAVVLAEMTKAFVRIERQLSTISMRVEPKAK